MNVQEFAELAAGYALNALSPDDERAFASALVEHPEWVGIADADAETAVLLSEGVADVTPPPGIRTALLALIVQDSASDEATSTDHTESAEDTDSDVLSMLPMRPEMSADDAAQAEPVERPTSTDVLQTVERRTWTRGVFALAASIVLLVALGFGAALVGDLLTPKPAAVVALQQIEDAPDSQFAVGETEDGGIITAHWSESIGKAVVVADDLPELSDDEVYQAWFVRGDTPIPAGVFDTDAGAATALLTAGMDAGDVIALTVEPAGGSKLPTTSAIVTIPTA